MNIAWIVCETCMKLNAHLISYTKNLVVIGVATSTVL